MKKILLIFISLLFFISCQRNTYTKIVKIGHVGESDRVIWKPVIEKLAKENIKIELISLKK